MRADTELTIRDYTPEDEGFVARLASDAFLEYTAGAVGHTLSLVRSHTSRVAVRGERRVGFIAADLQRGEVATLHAIAVVEHERGRGVGRALLLDFERLARRAGAVRADLCTADSNVAALDLFYKRGFTIVRRRSRFYARGQNACILMKRLD